MVGLRTSRQEELLAQYRIFDAAFLPGSGDDTRTLLPVIVETGEEARQILGRKADIEEQLLKLAIEFGGQPFILFYHAGLVAHLRRNIDVDKNWARFKRLWLEHTDYLLTNFNSRWLISACDTIVDHSEDSAERAMALCGTTLMAMIKLYETERLACHSSSEALKDYVAPKPTPPLFDGLMSYGVGRGDMIRNFLRRLQRPFPERLLASKIVQELARRSQQQDTVLKRFADVHKNQKTKW